MQKLCVFCGSKPGNDPQINAMISNLAQLLNRHNFGLVYGGGKVGLMGQIADKVLANNGEVIGVIPEALKDRELAHDGLTELHIVAHMHERKKLMYDLSEGFLAIPGGMGTLDEFCEIVTWAQLGYHDKPCLIFNFEGYFDPLCDQLTYMVKKGFLSSTHRKLIKDFKTLDELDKLISKLIV